MFDLPPIVVAAAEVAAASPPAQGTSIVDINWMSVAIPVIIQLLTLVYLLGGIRSQIDNLSTRIEKLENDSEKERDSSRRVDDRVHDVALSQARIETLMTEVRLRVDSLCLEASECPLAQGPASKRVRRARSSEPDA